MSATLPVLHDQIMRLRAIDNSTNLKFLAGEYLCLAAVAGGAIAFSNRARLWGLSWAWDLPVLRWPRC